MNFAFLIDSPSSLHIEKDTSFALMLEAQTQKHGVFILERGDLTINEGLLFATLTKVRLDDNKNKPFDFLEKKTHAIEFIDILFIRTDPPFDTDYITDTWFLSHGANKNKKPLVLNSPHGLRTINEKIWATQFKEFTPPTLITSKFHEFEAFLREHRAVVLKPTDGFGGSQIFVLRYGDPNTAVIFETLVDRGRYAIVQRYLDEAKAGDKRILVLEGEILGAVLRLHGGKDHRNNFAAGGSAQETQITERERAICEALKPYLQELGIFLAGLDFIGERLIEVNVTSPTCLREMQCYYQDNLAKKIIDAAVAKAQKIK